ncbi:MAG: hypothetical protein F6K63_06220 [Moorea sp. SIO1G6]|uniref:hypothetical protein n=1 Tax=Moorena sp. SIO1G6 TaxID=2607840 RepID=UPI0013BF2F41|nr:hypothetical protein [Moorena sp. SIO1G6]NET64020.1 hypothetical protein [Moorena sp. SIO1G6]
MMSIAGTWGQSEGQSEITVEDMQVTITMGTRPNGRGVVICSDPDVIRVNFPDDRVYIGTLINQNQIQWAGIGTLNANNVWTR